MSSNAGSNASRIIKKYLPENDYGIYATSWENHFSFSTRMQSVCMRDLGKYCEGLSGWRMNPPLH